MARVCERPTCSQPADVTYGIDPYELVVCIEPFDDSRARRAGVLCRGHADSMVVPQGWTLDDRRESAPRLFQSRESAKVKPRLRRPRRRKLTDDDTGQLRLSIAEAEYVKNLDEGLPVLAPWVPVFDHTDDLDGLLKARSPLLSRAFGKDKRSGKSEGARSRSPEGSKSERRSRGTKAV